MSSPRLYEFFVVDDAARWRAMTWSVLMGGSFGFFASAYGIGLNWSVAVTAVSSLGTLALFIAWYPYPRVEGRTVPFREQRRQLLRLGFVGVMEGVLAGGAIALLWNKTSAIAYAQSATEAIRSRQSVSPLRTIIAKQVISNSLRTEKDNPQLLKAYAQLTAAEQYSRVAELTPEIDEPPATWARPLEITKAITLMGAGKRSTVIAISHAGSVFIVGARAFTLESMGFRAIRSEPSIFLVNGLAGVSVKNCAFRGFRQNLDHIAWIDVDFEDCILESTESKLTLLNVSFKNCVLPPALAGLPIPVTYSSSGRAIG